jgi:hypothetical protein
MRQVRIDGAGDQAVVTAPATRAGQPAAPEELLAAQLLAEQFAAVPRDLLVPVPDHMDTASPAAAPPPGGGIDASSVVAWQAAIEQLLQLIGPESVGGLLGSPEPSTPASYVPHPDDASNASVDPPLPTETTPAAPFVIEALPAGAQPVLSLDESDLFGDADQQGTVRLLSADPSTSQPLFNGMDSDLFGPDHQDGPIKIAAEGINGTQGPTIGPVSPDQKPPPNGDGYLSLLDGPHEIKLTVDDAKSLADDSGALSIAGDGDDQVYLSGDWIYAGEAKGATYYTDATSSVNLVIHNTDVVLV